MHKSNRRPIRPSNTEKIISELAILEPSSSSSVEHDDAEYIGSMALELSKMALLAEKGFLGYLLDLAAKEARSGRNCSRRHI